MAKELKANGNQKVVGSQDYFNYLNDKYLKGIMPRQGTASYQYFACYNDIVRNFSKNKKYADITKKYSLTEKNVKNSAKQIFQPIAAAIAKDISDASESNNFMRHENGQTIETVLNSLKSCGVTGLDTTIKKVTALSWYVDLDKEKIKKLQRLLVELGYGYLVVDGIYSEATDTAWGNFMRELEYGDLIQVKVLEAEQFVDNVNVAVEMANQANQATMVPVLMERGGAVTTEAVEQILKEGMKSSTLIKIGQRRIIIWGVVLDLLEVGDSVRKDLNNLDNTISKKTFQKILGKSAKWGVFTVSSTFLAKKILVISTKAGPMGVLVGAIATFAVVVIVTAAGEDIGEYLGDYLWKYVTY